jgi:hypothetical protein
MRARPLRSDTDSYRGVHQIVHQLLSLRKVSLFAIRDHKASVKKATMPPGMPFLVHAGTSGARSRCACGVRARFELAILRLTVAALNIPTECDDLLWCRFFTPVQSICSPARPLPSPMVFDAGWGQNEAQPPRIRSTHVPRRLHALGKGHLTPNYLSWQIIKALKKRLEP